LWHQDLESDSFAMKPRFFNGKAGNCKDLAGEEQAKTGVLPEPFLKYPLLAKVFENLLDNSLRHGEHVRHIRVTYEMRGDALALMYRDDGAGIPAADKKRIFEKGFGKNTGLGLFLTREILAITGIGITETGLYGGGVQFELLVPAGAFKTGA